MTLRAAAPPAPRRARLAAGTALILIFAALLFLAFLWPRAAWVLSPDGDRALAERALGEGAAMFGEAPEDYRWIVRPTVSRPPGRDCVTLRTKRRDGGGSHHVCYDSRTGEAVEERSTIGF